MPTVHPAQLGIAEAATGGVIFPSAKLLELMRQAAAEGRSLRLTVDEGPTEAGRVVLINGRVMWAACRGQRRVVSTLLVRVGGVAREQLQSAIASDEVKNGQKPLFAVLEERKLIERRILRRCVCLHVRAALRGLLGRNGGQVTARPFSAKADESLLLRIDEVLPARERRPARPAVASESASRRVASAKRAEDGPLSLSSFATIPASPPLDAAAAPPRAAEGDATEGGVRRALGELTAVEQVLAAVVVGRDGFILDAASSEATVNTEAIGAVIAAGMGSAEVMGTRLAVGEMTQSMFEYDGGVILASAAGEAIVAVVTGAQANLGMVRHQFRKRCVEIAGLL